LGQAARSIGISEPSLHRAVTDLEKLLRRPLLVHAPSGSIITQQGAVLASRLNTALSEIRLAFEEIDDRKDAVNAKILIGSQSTAGAAHLACAIDRLLTKYPDVSVDVVEAPYEYLLASLLSGKIDILFDMLRSPPGMMEIVEERIHQDSFVVVCASGHPLGVSSKAERADLASYEWVIPPPGTPQFQALQRLLGSLHAKVRLVTRSRGLTRALLAGSDRLTLMPRQEALAEESLGTLRIVPLSRRIIAPALGIASRKSWLPTRMQQIFLQTLRDVVREGQLKS
jgi:DNA-binding transcriptional LysR family regulator